VLTCVAESASGTQQLLHSSPSSRNVSKIRHRVHTSKRAASGMARRRGRARYLYLQETLQTRGMKSREAIQRIPSHGRRARRSVELAPAPASRATARLAFFLPRHKLKKKRRKLTRHVPNSNPFFRTSNCDALRFVVLQYRLRTSLELNSNGMATTS
jgi:hypothetical protein